MKCLIISIIVIGQFIYTQQPIDRKISGIVTDAETNEPIRYANIFISNSSIGTASDKFGYYELNNIHFGRFKIIASVIGYEPNKVEINSDDNRNDINFELTKNPIEFPDINVTAQDIKKRKKRLKKFRKNLLGNSQNGKKSIITNEDIIRFEESDFGVLKASADEPLIVLNKSLGYKISYLLGEFKLTADYVRYTGYPHITELPSTSKNESMKWAKNRAKTYRGSLRHFLTTICENYEKTIGDTSARQIEFDESDVTELGTKVIYGDVTHIEDEGFYITQVEHPTSRLNRKLVNTNLFLQNTVNSNEMYLKFDDYLEVRYQDEYFPFENNIDYYKKYSWINIVIDSTIINTKGYYYSKYTIKTNGVWGLERVADMLPFDYEIE